MSIQVNIIEEIIEVDLVDETIVVNVINGITVYDEGIRIGAFTAWDFIGSGVEVTKQGTKALVTVTGGGSSGGGVTSFNTRTGAVVPASGDYNASQITNISAYGQSLIDDLTAAAARVTLIALEAFKQRISGSTANRFHGSGEYGNSAGTTQTSGANTLRAYSFRLFSTTSFDRIQAEVTTLVGGSSFRIGVYSSDSNCYPDALQVGSAQLSGAANAVVPDTIVLTLQPGLYWLAMVADASVTFRSWQIVQIPLTLGLAATMGAAMRPAYWNVAFTFAALPATFPAGAAITTTNEVIQILLRST